MLDFYGDVLQNIRRWTPPPPKLQAERDADAERDAAAERDADAEKDADLEPDVLPTVPSSPVDHWVQPQAAQAQSQQAQE